MGLYGAAAHQGDNLHHQDDTAQDDLADCRDFLNLRCSHAVSPSVGLVGQ